MTTWGLILIFFLTLITVYLRPNMSVGDWKAAKLLAILTICMVFHESILRVNNPFALFVGYAYGVVTYFGLSIFIFFGILMWCTNRDRDYKLFGLFAAALAAYILITSFYLP